MKVTGRQIVESAREMIGTPFVHQARVPGKEGALDCIGLPVCVGRSLGLKIEDRTDYPRETNGEMLRESLLKHCARVHGDMAVGDLVQFLIGRSQWHVGIVSRTGEREMMIHACSDIGGGGQVREDVIDRAWSNRLFAVWRLRGVGK